MIITPQAVLLSFAFGIPTVLFSLIIRSMNRNHAWDKMALHGREMLRHVVTVILLVGTTAGTLFTFSNGLLRFAGIGETFSSAGGIALALESGVILSGWYIGEVDARLLRSNEKDSIILRKQRTDVFRWFVVLIAFSFTANVIFRWQTMGAFLSIFISLAPVALVYLFTIILRPLPVDYEAHAKNVANRSLLITTQNAGAILNRLQAKMTAGKQLTPQELQQFQAAQATIGMWTPAKQAGALERIGHFYGVAALPAPSVVTEYWTSHQIADQYGRSVRWAEMKLANTIANVRKGGQGVNEAPKEDVIRALGEPTPPVIRLVAERKSAKTQRTEPQDSATDLQEFAPAGIIEGVVSE